MNIKYSNIESLLHNNMKSGISPERSARNGAELPQHLAKSNLSEAKPPMSQ